MEAGGDRFAKESQRGVAVGTITQIAEDLIESVPLPTGTITAVVSIGRRNT